MTPAIGCFLVSGIALIALMLIVRGGGFLVTPSRNYKRGLWTSAMVDMAVTKGSITTAEKAAIIKPVVVEPIIKEITK